MIRTFYWSLLALLIAALAFIVNSIYFDIPRKVLEEKYTDHTSKFLRLSGGGRLHFTDEGDKDRHTILLLHGFTGSHRNFKKMSPLLSNDLRVITLDLPGFGLTGAIPSKDYSINSAMNVINELVENLEIDKFSIGGNSMGWQGLMEIRVSLS
ncbi:MAG: alpha/beta fold hydrolase [Candidatus Azotimanducaceae bacterium]